MPQRGGIPAGAGNLNLNPKWPFWVGPLHAGPASSTPVSIPPDVPHRKPYGPLLRQRGRRFDPPFPLDTAPIARRVARARVCPAQPRGKQTFPVQPQIPVPPTIPGNRSPAGRRLDAPARGRRWQPIPVQDTPVWPPRPNAARSKLAARRKGSLSTPVPVQLVPVPRTATRWRTAALRRGRATNPVLTQTANLAPAWPPPKLGAPRRLLSGAQKGHRWLPTPAQIAVPPTIPGNRWSSARSKGAFIRRGSRSWPVPAQAPAPTPPCITLPTKATLVAYTSSAAVSPYAGQAAIRAYTSTGAINGYFSDGDITDYSASPAIVAYTSKATVVTYTSSGRIGPTFCG